MVDICRLTVFVECFNTTLAPLCDYCCHQYCFAPLVIKPVVSSHNPFPKDLTADGDTESNPGPISESALQTLLPDEWIDDEVIDEYCKYLFNLHNYPVECFISPTLMLHNTVDTTTQQFDDVLLTNFIIQQLTKICHCRYFIAPVINNTGTKGYHWGLLIIDRHISKWLFIDPNYDTNDFYLDEENVECPSGSFNVFLSTVHSALCVLEYMPIIVPVTQKQTPNDCGVYVLEYIRIFVHALNFRNIDNVSAVKDELQNANKYIDAGSVRQTIINYFVPPTVTTADHPESRKSKPREPSGASPAKRKSKISPASPLPPTVLKPVPVTPIRVSKKIRTRDPLSQSGLTPQTRKHRIAPVSESQQTIPSQSPPSIPASIPEVQPEQEPNQPQKFCVIEDKKCDLRS
ncbi:hypothetical protein GEMRC1_003970 [Eukaryota sp. GEM-RC1]